MDSLAETKERAAMRLSQMPAKVVGKGELEGSWWNMAIMLLLVVLAYLLVPLGLAISYNVSIMLAILGIVAFFGLSFPVQQPAGFSTLLKVGLLLIGAGILARILPTMLLLRSALELIDITVSTERSFAFAFSSPLH